MVAPTQKFPTNLPRRAASAVRHFPSGCGIVKPVSKPNLSHLSPVESKTADADASSTPMTTTISFNSPKEPSPKEESENDANFVTKKKIDAQLFANSRRPPRVWAVRDFPNGCGPAAAAAAAAALVVSSNEADDVEGIKDETNKKTGIVKAVSKPNLSLSPVESNTVDAAASSTPMTTTVSSKIKESSPEEESVNGANFETKKKIDVQLFANSRRPRVSAVRDFPHACGPAAASLVVSGNEAGDVEGIKDETGNARKHSTKGVRDNADSTDKKTGSVKAVSKPNISSLSPVESITTDAAASVTAVPTTISFKVQEESSPEEESVNGANFETKKKIKIDVQPSPNSGRRRRAWAVRDFPHACGPASAASVVSGNEAGDVEGIKDETKEFSGNARKRSAKSVRDNADSSGKKTRIVVQALMAAKNCPWRVGKVAGDVEGIKDETNEFSGNAIKHSTKSVRDNADSSDKKTMIVVQALMAAENCPWRSSKGKIGIVAGSAAAK